ncbi:hypothetical protein BXT86_05335 [candidate division WOR-3 bacterium 4484_100]|uniref:PTS EIIA type-2 domain-containing protein n=1 Tax=candidate division WOR-3 bacterium 4484_100 TaxID=1936077 RepID=A0A1V4QF84_UNCW3|nr:MAG: hypothetical protein BXT86_05335 [candidate division WOR-3 bacterium 4484_100]
MELAKLIDKGFIKILKATTKDEALSELIDLLGQRSEVKNIAELKKMIFYREKLMSTGIGLGIAIPHIRVAGIEKPVVVVGLSPSGISDYESIDNQPVRVIIMIVAGAKQHKEYIKILSQIVSLLKNEPVRQQLFQSRSIDEVYNILIKG